MICAGIDAGSRTVKAVILDCPEFRVVASGVRDQGVDHDASAQQLFDELLAAARLSRSRVARIVATGYARRAVAIADTTVTEITCHAVGTRHVAPDAASVIEMGGQDSKFLRLNADGSVRDFTMNDRCAAGTGRFLELVAARLGVGLGRLADLARQARTAAPISSTCAVFAETEIIGLLASGVPAADIVAGVQASVASRVAGMVGRDPATPVIFTGGVALVPGMAEALAAALKVHVRVAPDPQMTGALGAALLAFRSFCD